MLALGGQMAWGFALLGPSPGGGAVTVPLPATADPWQVVALGYDQPYINYGTPGGPVWLGDVGGPKNIGEEYRRNAAVVYYAYDANFAGFFGAQGEQAADQAFAIMNSLTNVDSYSANLNEFPFGSQHFNSTAVSLYLTDLKSVTLHLVVEQMGLAGPERYTWTLHNRAQAGPPCPFGTTYTVVMRNLSTTDSPLNDPASRGTQYSPYVNNVLYTYGIAEACGATTVGGWTAITIPFSVDLDAAERTAVAANDFEGGVESGLGGLGIGGFYTGLTRDDVAGLRYLMTTNNINLETAAAGSLLQETNLTTQQLLFTADLGALLASSKTNPPATLATLFPGVVVAGSSNYFTVATNPIVVSYFTNYPGSPVGNPPVLVIFTNGYTYTPVTNYATTFANVVITTNWFANSYRTNTSAQLLTINVATLKGAPVGSPLKTNISLQNITLTNVPSGDYYLIPPGSCGFDIFSPQPSGYPIQIVTSGTNVITTATNSEGFFYQQSIVTRATNHIFVVYPCTFVAGATGDYQGIQRVQFVRLPDNAVDPLTGNLLQPFWVTNYYTMVFYNPTNSRIATQTFQRIVTRPDFLLTATDQAVGPAGNGFNGTVTRNILFHDNNILPGLAGPGSIEGSVTFDYNKVGTIFWNGPFPDTNSFLIGPLAEVNETTQSPSLLWASYDGSTNDPVVYPTSLSIQQLENQMIVTVSPPPPTLPDGTNNVPYYPPGITFTVTGGQPPYTWSLANGTMLPNGLSLDAPSGLLSGMPINNPPGTYDFTIQMNDSAARSLQWNYSIIIH